jgi:Xaa-Pro aminopeptidase
MKGPGYGYLTKALPPGSTVGFQSDVVTVNELAQLKKELRRVRFVPITREVTDISCSKEPSEIAAMQAAAAVGDKALKRLLAHMRPGVTEREVAAKLDRFCADCGSEKPSFDTIVLFGARSSLPHGRPTDQRLKRGDFVLIDFGCTVSGFCSDMTRTFVCGEASARQRLIYDCVKKAHDDALAVARPGPSAAALDSVARAIIKKAGFANAFGHGLGHGVGRRIHERPRLSAASKDSLPEGCVITIEPGIYLPRFGGVRIEDMALLTGKGPRLLTSFPRELIELNA